MSIPRPATTRWRDSLLFLVGLGLIVNEAAVRDGAERPTLLILYAGMVGLPAFLRVDERRRETPDAPATREVDE